LMPTTVAVMRNLPPFHRSGCAVPAEFVRCKGWHIVGPGGSEGPPMEWEDEETWLRRRLIRLRTIWRFAKDPRVEAGLKEFIAEAEHRLEMLESRGKQKFP
jgi:hypothetical protein